ncbi:MAG: hypothetical protein JF606_13150 [Burkholderiales bacterium]|nr:hypothetical protein [Burkholderiales bacterium]
MLKLITTLAAASIAQVAFAQGAPRLLVEEPRLLRTLLVAAVDSPTGEAHGQMSGDIAKMMSDRFRTTGPILIDITTERRYAQPGCSRLKIRFAQDGVVMPGASAPQNKTVDIGLNYCRDGLPPKSLS